mmetsp:Transcript_41618/g.75487  ORF Transcript_41618/g.75487 Transcript_41618/m.75487 type:complete len:338 (-) Transcript_41618:43-1056(-)
MAASGPGYARQTQDEGLPDGWEAFVTCDSTQYYGCFERRYYYLRSENLVQWERPSPEDAKPTFGPRINGKRAYQPGDEVIPLPPRSIPYDSRLSDVHYTASAEDEEDIFEADEDMLQAVHDLDLQKFKKALGEGADISLPNWPWKNTPLHLVCGAPRWDAETFQQDVQRRLELAEYIVRQGGELEAENYWNLQPIDMASFHGYEAIVSLLKNNGCKLGWFSAAFEGDIPRLMELLREGHDIDQTGRYGRTAFAEASLNGQWAAESFLAQQGCSRELPHPIHIKFNPGGQAAPGGLAASQREIQYHREDNPAWYDDMMQTRFPGYMSKIVHAPQLSAN